MGKTRSPFAGLLDGTPDLIASESKRRGLEAPEQCVKEDKDLLETWQFVHSLLQRVGEVDKYGTATRADDLTQQTLVLSKKRRRRRKRPLNAVRREIGPFVVLGLQYIIKRAKQMKLNCADDPVLSDQVDILLKCRLTLIWVSKKELSPSSFY